MSLSKRKQSDRLHRGAAGQARCSAASTPQATSTPCGRAARWLLVALVFVVVAALASFGGAPLQAANDQSVLLHLRYASFDPLVAAPARAASDMIAAPTSGQHPFFVQFAGPIRQEWREAVVAAGAQIVEYAPDYAYVVLTDAAATDRLRALAGVRWVGYVQPVYRIDSALLGAQNALTVTISFFDGTRAAPVRAAVQQSGGDVLPETLLGESTVLRAVVHASIIRTLAVQPEVAWIEAYRQPRLWNEVARGIMNVSPVWNAHGLSGYGQTIAIADTGLDTGSMGTVTRDLRGRIVAAFGLGRPDDWSDPDGHGTHVAGSALGNGVNSGSSSETGNYGLSHAGVAPQAGLVVQSILDEHGNLGGIPADLGVLLQQAYDAGARIHSNSWGVAADDGGRVYDSHAIQVDKFTWEHPDMLVVVAAGNDGEDENGDGVVDMGSVTTPATAKNALSVGASESVRLSGGYNSGGVCNTWGGCWPDAFSVQPLKGDRLSDNADGMAAFSSRGPAPDGRIKPDLVAPGTNIVSTRSTLAPASNYWGVYDEYYAYNGGTSMSAPLAAGAAALVRQYYAMAEHNASAALVKATLLAGAEDMTPGQFANHTEMAAAPNNVEGWGRLNVSNALFPIAPRRVAYIDATTGLTTGQSLVYTYTVASSSVSLRVILAWSDYPGSPRVTPNLVNNLDLLVTGPERTMTGAGAANTPDGLNNVEGVIIAAPAAGEYRITVSGRNVPFGPQPFALVVSGDLSEPPTPPAVTIDHLPGFAAAESPLAVTWSVSGGAVVTSTTLYWDDESHSADYNYAHGVVLTTTAARSYSATVALPASGTVYLMASVWIDGQCVYAEKEQTVNIVRAARVIFLPVIVTYPPPQPTPTPKVSATPAAARQLIQNRGFEDGAPQAPPWQQYDRADPNGLLVMDGPPCESTWCVWMGGYVSDFQQVYQTVAIPPGTSSASVTFHWYMVTEDTLVGGHDVLSVRLLNAAGEALTTIVQRDNTATRGQWMTTRYSWLGDFPFAGQTVRLSFEYVTDAALYTSFYLDDVSFWVSPGPIDGIPAGIIEAGGG